MTPGKHNAHQEEEHTNRKKGLPHTPENAFFLDARTGEKRRQKKDWRGKQPNGSFTRIRTGGCGKEKKFPPAVGGRSRRWASERSMPQTTPASMRIEKNGGKLNTASSVIAGRSSNKRIKKNPKPREAMGNWFTTAPAQESGAKTVRGQRKNGPDRGLLHVNPS